MTLQAPNDPVCGLGAGQNRQQQDIKSIRFDPSSNSLSGVNKHIFIHTSRSLPTLSAKALSQVR